MINTKINDFIDTTFNYFVLKNLFSVISVFYFGTETPADSCITQLFSTIRKCKQTLISVRQATIRSVPGKARKLQLKPGFDFSVEFFHVSKDISGTAYLFCNTTFCQNNHLILKTFYACYVSK